MQTKEISVRLPEPLFANLAKQAESTGTTLEELVVYALARQTTQVYEVLELGDDAIDEQKRRHDAFMQTLQKNGEHIPLSEAERILSEREQTEPDPESNGPAFEKLRNFLHKPAKEQRR